MKRPFRGSKVKKKAPSNPNQMMAQVQQMQADMAKAQEALENEFVTVSAAGGAITIEISGHQRVKSIVIDKEFIDHDDPENLQDLQDLMTIAVNQAIEQSQAMSAERMEGISSGMGGLNDMLGGMGLNP
ncbi:MAG: DNA-binding YbaB/EbfC family protein [Cellvibrionaceae bacterium]|jgi:DNA-binding YbaB/EbfC family protein